MADFFKENENWITVHSRHLIA